MANLSESSTEYVQYTVIALKAGTVIDPTTDAVSFAFTQGTASPTAWVSGSWDTWPNGNTVAKVLIGPNGTTLAPGAWIPWIKITDNPEVPVIELPTLTITAP